MISRNHAMRFCLTTILVLCATACGAPPAAPVAQVPQVQVVAVQPEDVPLTKTFVGRTVSRLSVELKCNVTGYLLERPFTEGGLVQAGDVLFRIDPREFQANLETAQAKQAQAEARLAQAEVDLKRIEPLAKAGAAPVQDLDNARTNQLSAQADLRAAKAAVTNAEITLSYTTIKAPFAGRVGKASVDPGALISPQLGVLATIDQVDPIAVEFTVSEEEILRNQAGIAAGSIATAGIDHFVVQVTLLDGRPAKDPGRIDFADIRINPDTGTALVRAVVPNTTGRLVPGQFVRTSIVGLVRKGALMIPQAAVVQSPTGASVFAIDAEGKAGSVPVTLGDWVGNRWVIESGLTAGMHVVVDGVQKVRAGAKVQVVAVPDPAAAPAK